MALGLAACEGAPMDSLGRLVVMPEDWDCPGIGSDFGSSFGVGGHSGRGERHRGIDIVAPHGHPVIAAADGYYVGSGREDLGGNWVVLIHRPSDTGHDTFVATYYYHLAWVRPGLTGGDRVSRGELLGRVGNDGIGAGTITHLHFETWSTPGESHDRLTSPTGTEAIIHFARGTLTDPNDLWAESLASDGTRLVIEPFHPDRASVSHGLTWPVVCDPKSPHSEAETNAFRPS